MSSISGSPLQDVAAFKDHVRRHCEQRYVGLASGPPGRSIPGRSKLLGQGTMTAGSPTLDVSQMQPMFAGGNDDPFFGPSPMMVPQLIKAKSNDELRRSSDGSQLQQSTYAGRDAGWPDPFLRPPPTYSMIPKHIQQQHAEVQVSHDEFRVDVDVTAYAPDEIDVKIVGDQVIIRGRHADDHQGENANISREFSRRYTLPEDTVVGDASVFLAKSGMLCVKVPRKTTVVEENHIKVERKIKVKFQDEH